MNFPSYDDDIMLCIVMVLSLSKIVINQVIWSLNDAADDLFCCFCKNQIKQFVKTQKISKILNFHFFSYQIRSKHNIIVELFQIKVLKIVSFIF